MAALPEAQVTGILDLSEIRSSDLEPVLQEESQAWKRHLDWDFRYPADLVRRFLDARGLSGYALSCGGRIIGYTYFVAEDHKGLIGDLFISDQYRTVANENRLFKAAIDRMAQIPQLHRIETQIMLMSPGRYRPCPPLAFFRSFERQFLNFDLSLAPSLEPISLEKQVVLDLWTERRQEEAAQVIVSSYRGHIDASINDQYRSLAGARRFLQNVVQYPGCGNFYGPASWVAIDRRTSQLCAICLASMVAPAAGHITQLCVTPEMKGMGLGYELLRRTLNSLARSGARKTSLTVTSANRVALDLYKNAGFIPVRRFPALIWEFS